MNNVNLQTLVEKASEMAMRNVWGDKAYKVNMAILKMDNNNCAACTRLAKYYKLNDNISEAKNMYQRALDIDPNNRGAINNLDEMAKEIKENEAVEKIKTIGQLFKEGQSSMVKGRYNLAVKLFSKAFSIEPILMYAVSLAGAYKKVGKYDNIEELYTQLIERNHLQVDVDAINNEFRTLRLNQKVC